jgi:tetratricopeptide (TPR) repeat protein/DNA-binding CsgD family transcriptional regulator
MKQKKAHLSKPVAALLDEADEHLDKDEYAVAERIANEVLSLGARKDDLARVFCILGTCCASTNRRADASKHYSNALTAAEAASNLSLQARALNGLAYVQNKNRTDPNATLHNAQRALVLAEKAKDKRQKARAFTIIGYVHHDHSDRRQALDYYNRALSLSEEIDDKYAIATNLGNIGGAHLGLADYPQALDYSSRALALADELGDKATARWQLNNIGYVHNFHADYPRALGYYARALSLAEELGDKEGIERSLGDIGVVHDSLANYPLALDYYTRALAIAEEIGSKGSVARHLNCIGTLHCHFFDYPRALGCYSQSLSLAETIGDKNLIAFNLGNIGEAYRESQDYPRALDYLRRALELCEQIGTRRPASYWMHSIAMIERKLGNLDAAYQGMLDTLHYLRDELKTNDLVADTLLELGGVLFEQGKVEEGLTRMEEALALAEELGEKQAASEAHKEIAGAYSQMGDGIKAYEHLSKHLALNKEIFSEESRKNVEKFNMRVAIAGMESEKELQRLRAEQSEKELANSTLQLVSQTELLTELRDDLLGVVRKFPMPDGAAKELRDRIKLLPCKSVDWAKFDMQFKAAHPEFTKKLAELHPTLTAMELRICSLLRMNLTSEEIARLFCLSSRAIESHRFRIRKRIGIPHTTDLAIYLAKI